MKSKIADLEIDDANDRDNSNINLITKAKVKIEGKDDEKML